jgi:hypothetical protein
VKRKDWGCLESRYSHNNNQSPRGGICYRPSVGVDNGTTFFLSDCVIDVQPAENSNVSTSTIAMIGGHAILITRLDFFTL